MYATILQVPFYSSNESPIWEASFGQFEVNFDVVSLHPVLIDLRLGSSRSMEMALIAGLSRHLR